MTTDCRLKLLVELSESLVSGSLAGEALSYHGVLKGALRPLVRGQGGVVPGSSETALGA